MTTRTATTASTTLRGVIGCVLVVVLFITVPVAIRTLLYQPFSTPSGSQKPTLLVGDYFFVAKFAYGYTHYSLPYSPNLFSGRIWAAEPRRGDMVVFRLPKDLRRTTSNA